MAGRQGSGWVIVVAAAFLLAPTGASRAADGRAIVMNGSPSGAPHCESCHGLTGQGIPANGYPRLAGLNVGYLFHQLNSFADGSRVSSMMSPVARELSLEDRWAVAAYYASQSPPQAIDQAANSPEAATRGRALATVGLSRKGLPACNQCHGPNGEGVGDAFPRLAGQSAKYIENQLAAFRNGERQDDPLHLMAGMANPLDDADAKAVATYYATLPVAGKKD